MFDILRFAVKNLEVTYKFSGFGDTIFIHATSLQQFELDISWGTLHFVGWVETTQELVGFLRLRRTNLQFVPFECEMRNPTTDDYGTEPQKVSFSIELVAFQASLSIAKRAIDIPDEANFQGGLIRG